MRTNSSFEGGEDAVSQSGIVGDERGVEAGYAEVGFGEGHFHVTDHVEEEGELPGHDLQEGEAAGLLA